MRPLPFIFLVLAFVGFATGHELNTLYAPGVGARAMGMGGAFVAMSGDPTCLFWNPAGCAWVKKPSGYIEGAFEERWQSTLPDYRYYSYYPPSDSPLSYSSNSTTPRAIALLVPLKEVVLGFGAFIPYETRLRDGAFTFRNQTVEPRAVGKIQRISLSISTGKRIGSLPKASVGFNLNYDRFHYERAGYEHSIYSYSYPWGSSSSEWVDINETQFDDRGFNFDMGALIETEDGLAVGLKMGVASDWEGDGNTRKYQYYSSHQRDTLRDTATVQEDLHSGPFKSLVSAPQFLTLGLRISQEKVSLGAEITVYHRDYPQVYAVTGSDIHIDDPMMFSDWGIPTARAGIEVQPVPGLFLRGGSYAFGMDSYYSETHEPACFTAGIGFARQSLSADLAVEHQSSKVREKSTRATLGLTYALGK